jgi:ribulose-phosphate 3-epimerase
MKGKILSASILGHNTCRIADGVRMIEEFRADWIHIDVMDGTFVPNITFGQGLARDLRGMTNLFLDVHLMIQRPERLIESFVDAGVDMITFHCEASSDVEKNVTIIRNLKRSVGIAINPKTDVSAIENLLEELDLVLVMAVEPGKCSQQFLPSTCEKIRRLASLRDEKGLGYKISVDGGINSETISLANDSGADVFVTGSAFFQDPKQFNPFFQKNERTRAHPAV